MIGERVMAYVRDDMRGDVRGDRSIHEEEACAS